MIGEGFASPYDGHKKSNRGAKGLSAFIWKE
jgi:hypothetical protein